MTLSRRKSLALIGGGIVLAATATLGSIALRKPKTALQPWSQAGKADDPRMRALSYALLAPNPHNRQPWIADLGTPGTVTLYADLTRLLPETDPLNRQITIGLGCFLELMRLAALQDGYRLDITPFPEGSLPKGLDARPVAHVVFHQDTTTPDPLFAQALLRRTNKEPYDTTRPVAADELARLANAVSQGSQFGGSVADASIQSLRALTHEALKIEIETPRTYRESVDLFRIGRAEIDANPDGIDFSGPMFELMGATGIFTRTTALDTTGQTYKAGLSAVLANCDSAMGHVWLTTATNDRTAQLAAGADWLRLNLATTAQGLAIQPLSQALQEYPEMATLYAKLHERLAPKGGTIQMLARIGYGPEIAPSPRWPLESKVKNV